MPDKPLWYGRLEEAITALETLPFPWVDRAAVERLLGVGRRRAQQILAPCVSRRIGSSGVADRPAFVAHLRKLAAGETAYYERRRRRQLARRLEQLRNDWIERPRLLVEAPRSIARQEFGGLPEGIALAPGEIRLQFRDPTEALEKLLALAMAIGNDEAGFRRLVAREEGARGIDP